MLDAHHKSAWDTMLVVGMIFEVEMDTELGYDLISKNACNGYLKNAEITNPFTNWWLSLVQIDLQVGWSVKFGWFLPVIYFSWNLGECIVIPNWTSHQLQTIFWGASYFWSAYYTPRIGLYIFHLPLSLSLYIYYMQYIYIYYTYSIYRLQKLTQITPIIHPRAPATSPQNSQCLWFEGWLHPVPCEQLADLRALQGSVSSRIGKYPRSSQDVFQMLLEISPII